MFNITEAMVTDTFNMESDEPAEANGKLLD